MPNTETIGQRVKAARESQGFSLGKLASIADMSRSYLYELEVGQNQNPSLLVGLRLAAALGVTIEHLAYGEESEKRDAAKELEIASLKRRLAKIERLAKGIEL